MGMVSSNVKELLIAGFGFRMVCDRSSALFKSEISNWQSKI
jgi:hypothetical protein